MIGCLLNIIKIPKVIGVIWGGIMFGEIPWVMIVLPALKQSGLYIITYIIGIISILLLALLVKKMPKRTVEGTKILGKVSGFKRFLEVAEKSELEALVEKDPEYFYHLLPFTYALGISDVWIKQFETIAIQVPEWYDSYDEFDARRFNRYMRNTMESISSVPIIRETRGETRTSISFGFSSGDKSERGSGTGGGVSGCGFGGGGGSSW